MLACRMLPVNYRRPLPLSRTNKLLYKNFETTKFRIKGRKGGRSSKIVFKVITMKNNDLAREPFKHLHYSTRVSPAAKGATPHRC